MKSIIIPSSLFIPEKQFHHTLIRSFKHWMSLKELHSYSRNCSIYPESKVFKDIYLAIRTQRLRFSVENLLKVDRHSFDYLSWIFLLTTLNTEHLATLSIVSISSSIIQVSSRRAFFRFLSLFHYRAKMKRKNPPWSKPWGQGGREICFGSGFP